MVRLQVSEDDHDGSELSDKCTMAKPNLKGDWANFYLLILLYILQGFPIGLSSSIPIILQSKKMTTYEEQALFSIVLWPFTWKIVWAPIVDSLYVQRLGRRKSWLVPLQVAVGSILLYMANNIDDWMPASGKPNFKMLVGTVFAINFLSATQDIVVDGWALTMLKKNNVGYASTCNATGVQIGIFIGIVGPILLVSEEFSNKYLRTIPAAGGLITVQSFLYFWGILFLSITTLIGIYKKEKDSRLEDNHVKINVLQNYRLLWEIVKLPSIRLLAIILLTARIGFSAVEAVSNFKLIDAGVSKDVIMIATTGMFAVKFILPIFVSKYISGTKPMTLYLKFTPIRLLWTITYVALIYYTPSLIRKNGVVDVSIYYYIMLGLIFIGNEILSFFMLLTLFAFFCRISDSRFGGTYMALFNTFYFLGWMIPNTLVLKMVDLLTFNVCSNDAKNNCSTTDLNKTCTLSGGSCGAYVDGYYIMVGVTMAMGFVWYFTFKNILKHYQSADPSKFSVNVKRLKLQT